MCIRDSSSVLNYKAELLRGIGQEINNANTSASQRKKRARASVSGAESGHSSAAAAGNSSPNLPPPPPPPSATDLLPHPSPYHHCFSYPSSLKRANDGKISFVMSMANFPMVPAAEAYEDVAADFDASMNQLEHHEKCIKEMREKWLLCGPLNPRREEFLLTAETYVAGYRDLAQKQFKARFDMAMPRDKINKSAPPLVPGFTFSRRYSACLLYTSPSPRDKRQSRMPSSA